MGEAWYLIVHTEHKILQGQLIFWLILPPSFLLENDFKTLETYLCRWEGEEIIMKEMKLLLGGILLLYVIS